MDSCESVSFSRLTRREVRVPFQVQSFFRGWLCRRRWKQIVDEYIRSDHAESMRKRNRYRYFRCAQEIREQRRVRLNCILFLESAMAVCWRVFCLFRSIRAPLTVSPMRRTSRNSHEPSRSEYLLFNEQTSVSDRRHDGDCGFSIVFGMVACEEEYVKQLSALVTVFLRPLKMAASSKKPPISHEDVNSIFLNR